MMFTGRFLSAEEGHEAGVSNYLVPPEDFEERLREFAQEVENGPPIGQKVGKLMAYRTATLDYESALELSGAVLPLLCRNRSTATRASPPSSNAASPTSAASSPTASGSTGNPTMCRSIKRLRAPDGDAPDDVEIAEAARQFVRKVSGIRHPSQRNAEAFDDAVDESRARHRAAAGTSAPAAAPASILNSAS